MDFLGKPFDDLDTFIKHAPLPLARHKIYWNGFANNFAYIIF